MDHGIKLEKIIPTIISQKDRFKILASLTELYKPDLKLGKEALVFA
jgi:hypothetical protein